MSDLDASAVGEPPPPYMIFLVVFLFFVTGLLGFLVCHTLKKRGYRCRTWETDEEEEEEEEKEKEKEKEKEGKKEEVSAEDDDEDNQDTVEQILKCIIENEANMEAFKEMLGNQNVCALHDPRLLRKESVGGIPPHHHTVHSGSDRNSCHLCAQGRVKKGRRRSRTPKPKKPGEQTVFSVGRFRVIQQDKKLQGSPNPMADSGDQLNQSQDSKDPKDDAEDPKEGGFNLRNMFKDVKQPAESSNGAVPNPGKRRKSLTIFGLGRRGSDPAGLKTASLPGGRVFGGLREGGVKFSKQAPVVFEEQLPTCPETDSATEVPYSVPLKGIAEAGSLSPRGLEPPDGPTTEPSVGAAAQETPVPSSLAIPTSLPSRRTLQSPSAGTAREEKKSAEVYSPGPQQTSTPIAPGYGVASGLTPSAAAQQRTASSSEGLLPSGTLPSPYSTSSLDADPGIGGSLASMTLGLSPTSLFPVQTTSPASLRTPTSSAVFAQSLTPPPHDSRNAPTEPVKTPSASPALRHSPQLTSVLSRSNQSPTTTLSLGRIPSPLLARTPSPALTLNTNASAMSPSPTPSAVLSTGPSQTSPRDALPHARGRFTSVASPASEPDQLPCVSAGDVHSASPASPPAPLGKDGPSSRPVSPGQSRSPSLPQEGRMSSVSIVKASPDRKREFSVVTMLEEEEPSILTTKEETGETSDLKKDLEKVDISPTVTKTGYSSVSGSVQTTTLDKELSTVLVVPSVSQGKDDIVEMKDLQEVVQDDN
ncbi:unnamed protein product [Arctogadus glacialis]